MKTKLTKNEIEFIENEMGYEFNKPELLTQAFTEKSLGVESNIPYNDVLKLMGESAINVIVMKSASESLNFEIGEERIINIFDNYNEVKELISKCNCRTIEQFIEEQFVQRYLSEYVLSISITEKGFENLILMSKGDVKNEVYKQARIKSELFKAIIGAIAIDSEWNFTIIEDVFFELLDDKVVKQIINKSEDDVVIFHKWHFKHYKDAPNYIYEEIGSHIYKCIMKLVIDNQELVFEGEGPKKFAKKMCCREIVNYLQGHKLLSNNSEIARLINGFTEDNAVNILQMLAQKKLIDEPIYSFNTTYDENGNPIWECSINLGVRLIETNKFYLFPPYVKSVKKEAKKFVAYFALVSIKNVLDSNDEFEIISKKGE